jgi:hypothetical protein
VFPGTHYTRENTVDWAGGGFTFTELLNANYPLFHSSGVYIGGHLNYQERQLHQLYTEVPHGMTRRFVPSARAKDQDPEQFRRQSLVAWNVVAKHYREAGGGGLPEQSKYPEDTWEWTIPREFYSHVVNRASYLLEKAIAAQEQQQQQGKQLEQRDKNQNTKYQHNQLPTSNADRSILPSLVDSAGWLEMVAAMDERSVTPALKKNLGLAYMHMVRNKEQIETVPLPPVAHFFGSSNMNWTVAEEALSDRCWVEAAENTDGGTNTWKSWASERWNLSWKEFLAMEGAQKDESYQQVKHLYDLVHKSATKNR